MLASVWGTTVAVAESVVALIVLGLLKAVVSLRDRVTRLESL
jgi:hypothetical protein